MENNYYFLRNPRWYKKLTAEQKDMFKRDGIDIDYVLTEEADEYAQMSYMAEYIGTTVIYYFDDGEPTEAIIDEFDLDYIDKCKRKIEELKRIGK